ncbi:MAG: hypothetical protein JWM47_335 [Acidimicrobiales bacterium]|nr:hypothetical protein [Acidimicrobiales bacterium]
MEATRRLLDEAQPFADNDRTVDLLLGGVLADIAATVERGGVTWAVPVFGSLPTSQPNACTIRVPGSDAVIVAFASGLPEFLNRIVKIVLAFHLEIGHAEYDRGRSSSSWTQQYAAKMADVISRRTDLQQRFTATLLGFAIGTPTQIPRHVVAGKVIETYRSAVLWGAELFVVGHEYGHAVSNHRGPSCVTSTERVGAVEVEVVQRSHAQEHVADAIGRAVSLAAIAERWWTEDIWRYRLAAAGAPLFLAGAELLERAQDALPDPPRRMDTHPSYQERRRQTEDQFRSITEGLDNPFVKEFSIILEGLWIDVERRLT